MRLEILAEAYCAPSPAAPARKRAVISWARPDTSNEFELARPGDLDIPDLSDPTGAWGHEHDPITEAHRFTHVVGHEDDRLAGFLPDAIQVVVELVARQRVEGRKGLVHEQQLGVLREGPSQSATLAHAARQLMRAMLREIDEPHHREEPVDGLVPFIRIHLAEAHRQLHVAANREPREQRRLLEHDRRTTVSDLDRSRRDLVQAGDEREEGRLATARGAEDAYELAFAQLERDVIERRRRALAVAEHLRDPQKGHEGFICLDGQYGGTSEERDAHEPRDPALTVG